jgi:hypothetical protein
MLGQNGKERDRRSQRKGKIPPARAFCPSRRHAARGVGKGKLLETVETVSRILRAAHTQLKLGVTERRSFSNAKSGLKAHKPT